ncbi:Methyl-accepting chemotaxis protein III [compost metagenome]
MGEISAASSEQSQGVGQVGEAITQMDQATQQNAALVEESAAAADSLQRQAQELVEAVAVFRLGAGAGQRAAPAPVAGLLRSPAGRRSPARTEAPVTAPALAPVAVAAASARRPAEGDWESF